MKNVIKPSLLALSISVILFPFSVSATPVLSVTGDTALWQGTGASHDAPIIEYSGATGTPRHDITVDNVYIAPGFTSSSGFNGMSYKAGISLGGNNGSLGLTAQNYGSLSLTVTNSIIRGSTSLGQFSGLYLR